MSLANLFSFNLANLRDDLLKKFDFNNNKKERVPLNLSKEATFTVQLRDPNMPNMKYAVDRKLLVLEDGLHIIDPTSKKQLFFFPFTSIKTFRLNIDEDDEWQIYFKKDGKRFEWYTFISPQAEYIHDTVLKIVDNIILDRTFDEDTGNASL